MNKKFIPVEILDLRLGDYILINFYDKDNIVKSKSGFVEKIDLDKLCDDVFSFVIIKNNKGELENIMDEYYNYSIYSLTQ
jgi:hypothetical protein